METVTYPIGYAAMVLQREGLAIRVSNFTVPVIDTEDETTSASAELDALLYLSDRAREHIAHNDRISAVMGWDRVSFDMYAYEAADELSRDPEPQFLAGWEVYA